MAKQTINTGTSANDRTGDTLRGAGTKINANFTELYNFLGGSTISAGTSQLTDSGMDIISAGGRTKLGAVNPASEINIDFGDSSGIVLVDTAIQTMSNKTLTNPQLNNPSLHDMRLWDADSSHRYTFVAGALSANRNITIPALSASDTMVMNNTSATLTNKTLTDPVVQRPKVHEYLTDSASNAVISFTNTFTPSRNNVKVSSKAAGTSPVIEAIGSDANLNLDLTSKGTGSVKISKAAVSYATAANSAAASVSAGFISLTGSSSGTVTLADGTLNGEMKTFARRGGGSGTVSVTPATFAQGTSINFDPLDTAQLIWDGTNGWNIIGGYGYAVV